MDEKTYDYLRDRWVRDSAAQPICFIVLSCIMRIVSWKATMKFPPNRRHSKNLTNFMINSRLHSSSWAIFGDRNHRRFWRTGNFRWLVEALPSQNVCARKIGARKSSNCYWAEDLIKTWAGQLFEWRDIARVGWIWSVIKNRNDRGSLNDTRSENIKRCKQKSQKFRDFSVSAESVYSIGLTSCQLMDSRNRSHHSARCSFDAAAQPHWTWMCVWLRRSVRSHAFQEPCSSRKRLCSSRWSTRETDLSILDHCSSAADISSCFS